MITNYKIKITHFIENSFGAYPSFIFKLKDGKSYLSNGCETIEFTVENITQLIEKHDCEGYLDELLEEGEGKTVTSFESLFHGKNKFNQSLNAWNVGNVTSMRYMLRGVKNFNQPLNGWDVSNVKRTDGMFYGARKFNQPLNGWDVSNVTNMSMMFESTKSFNQPLNGWNVSNVTDMQRMFLNAKSFNQDISNWDTSHVKRCWNMFYGCNIDLKHIPKNLLSRFRLEYLGLTE